MYYSSVPSNGNPAPVADKPGIYVQAPNPYGPTAPGYAAAQGPLPAGLTQRYSAAQPYAMMSNPYGSLTAPNPYQSSMQYSGMQALPPTSSPHAYLAASQYPAMSYSHAMGPRTLPPSPYAAAPMQAGAPLIAAAGYPGIPGAMGAPARSYQMGQVTAYPPGYPMGSPSSVPSPYGSATFGPPY